jgi:hypothetical protein
LTFLFHGGWGLVNFLAGVYVAQERQRELADRVLSGTRGWTAPADEWRTKVQRWVDAGIVSSSQGEDILGVEEFESPSHASHDTAIRPVLTPFVEFVSYFAVVVVGLGSALFLGHYWSRIGAAGRVSVSLMVTIVGLLGGYVVAQIGDVRSRRVSGFLRLVGTAGAAMAAAVIVGPEAQNHRGLTMLCVGIVALVLSAVLWRNLDRSLQFLSTILGLVITLGAVESVAHLHATSTEVALLVWFLAIAVGLMSLQMLRPALTALLVAEVGSFVGALALSFPNHLAGVLLGLVSALCAAGVGFALERPPIIVIGAVGFFMFDFRIFSIYLRSTDAALGAFVLGLALVFIALCRAMMIERRERSPLMEVHVDAEWYEPW